MAIFRREASLLGISRDTLVFLKATRSSYANYKNKDEEDRFDEELNQLLFKSLSDLEAFSKDYLEPLLVDFDEDSRLVGHFVDKPEFAPLFPSLAYRWIENYPMMPKQVLQKLFSICALDSDRSRLSRLIKLRCEEFTEGAWDESDDRLQYRKRFWYIRYFFFIDEGLDFVVSWLDSDRDLIFTVERLTDSHRSDEGAGVPDLTASKVYTVLDCYVEKWPKVNLPHSWGSNSSTEENAYRFLRRIFWQIGKDTPDQSFVYLGRIINDKRFSDFLDDAFSMRAKALRDLALRDFEAPNPEAIVSFLDDNRLATVEDFRSLLLEEFEEYQRRINGSEYDLIDLFYHNGAHVDEPTACKRVASDLSLRLGALNMSVSIELQMKDANRCDITAEKMLAGRRSLVVIEAKGQWHRELFSAAKTQLYDLYSIHQDAESQGIYLVFWFGSHVKVANKKTHSIGTADELKKKLEEGMPDDLRPFVDVFVLDLSKGSKTKIK